jgi:hypothetical protein
MARKPKIPAATVEMMRKLLSMPPKPHNAMKIGRAANGKKRGPKARVSSAKQHTA